MDIKTNLIKIIDSLGIYVDDIDISGDFDLREYIIDSLQFISMIVEIENEFDIEFPDDLLLYDNLKSFYAFTELLQTIILEDNG